MDDPAVSQMESLLKQHNQQHLLQFADQLSNDERSKLIQQIRDIDFSLLKVDADASIEPDGGLCLERTERLLLTTS